jgi:hypothetical protein
MGRSGILSAVRRATSCLAGHSVVMALPARCATRSVKPTSSIYLFAVSTGSGKSRLLELRVCRAECERVGAASAAYVEKALDIRFAINRAGPSEPECWAAPKVSPPSPVE